MADGEWIPVQHYLWRDDGKVGRKELERYAKEGRVEMRERPVGITPATSEECIHVTDSNRRLLFKSPARPAARTRKPLEDRGEYGWKLDDTICAEYRTALQNVADAARRFGLRVETKTMYGKLMIRLTKELAQALAAYKPSVPDTPFSADGFPTHA